MIYLMLVIFHCCDWIPEHINLKDLFWPFSRSGSTQLVPWLWALKVKENVLSARTCVVETARPPCDDQKTEKQERAYASPKYTLMTYVLQLGHTCRSFRYFLIIPSHCVLISTLINPLMSSEPLNCWNFYCYFCFYWELSRKYCNLLVFTLSNYRMGVTAFTVLPVVVRRGHLSSCLCSWSPCFSSLSC